MNDKFELLGLRSLRKASHLTGKVARKSGTLLGKIENRTTKMIVHKTGSADGTGSIPIASLIYHTFPQITPVHPSLPVINQRPSVTVFAFLDPRGFYGGIATLLCVAAEIALQLDYDLRIVQTTGFSDKADVLTFLESKGFTIPKERYSTINLSNRRYEKFGYLPLHPDDVVLVSAWWDAHIASKLPLQKKFIYLIQDYEPIFYNNSDLSVLAEQTYKTGRFIPIINTEILLKFFKEKGFSYVSNNAIFFEPAPAPHISPVVQKNKKGATKKLFLYGRPQVHRNLYYNALQAIDIALQDERIEGIQCEVYSAGASDLPNVRLSSGIIVNNLGKMDMDEYYSFAQTVDVAISPMLAPHPNYPTLELASLGSVVVTTRWETKQDLHYYSPNILLSDPNPEAMAESIVEAMLINDEKREENKRETNISGDWKNALRKPIEQVIRKL